MASMSNIKHNLKHHTLWLAIFSACSMVSLSAIAQSEAVDDIDSLEGDVGVSFDLQSPDDALTMEQAQIDAMLAEIDKPMATEAEADIGCDGKVCIEQSTGLPLQVLPRSFANVYTTPSVEQGNIAVANVAPFEPLYVFTRKNIDLSNPAEVKGWYQVGQNDKQPNGWMQAKDVLEWKQALIVAYTHPGDEIEGRQPVLMFKDLSSLRKVTEADDMLAEASNIYQQISTQTPVEGVISKEPERYVNINDQLYFLPILDWKQEEIEGEDVRLLQVAAAVPNARGADTIDAADYMAGAQLGRTDITGANIDSMKVDIVFVIDTTRSMQPYIDATRSMVSNIAERLSGDYDGDIKFGVVGYRDDTNVTPAIEYVAKNFTPELVDASELASLLGAEVKATQVGSRDYAEDVFAGVDAGIKSSWRDDAARLLVLVGDASSHPLGADKNTTKKDEKALLREIRDSSIHVLSIHLANPKAAKDHELAKEQFATLATIAGSDNKALFDVDISQAGSFNSVVEAVVEQFTGRYEARQDSGLSPAESATESETRGIVDQVWTSALVEYIGQSANPPKDIVAWVADKDLTNLADKSLEVRVLVTKEQLNNLWLALDRVLQALSESELSQGQFFDALQSVSGQTLKRPDDINQAQKLADTGLLPSFINSLPYKSDILSLDNDMFASMTSDQRARLEQELSAKLNQYRDLNENNDAWHPLNKDDPDSVMVHPLLIDYLP